MSVITSQPKPYNDVVMVEGFGALPVVANDNVPTDKLRRLFKGQLSESEKAELDEALFAQPLDESGASAGFAVGDKAGFFASLSKEQRALALAYRGDENHGQYIGLERGKHYVTPQPAWPERQGDFMATFSGRQYWPVDPRSEDVFIEDIAHSLSLQCRYAGHALQFYSVAEHSVHIARWLQRKYGPLMAMHGLLHDATEAYCVDVPRPLKPSLINYKMIEGRNWLAIAARYGLSRELPAEVHEADSRIIGDELVNMRPMEWHARHNEPLGVKIGCWSPDVAETEFLVTFEALTGRIGRVA
jgi:hypothetical protein